MAGLQFRTGLSASTGGGGPQTPPMPAPTIAAAAFGPGYTAAAPSTGGALSPGHPAGLQFWVGVGAVVFLAWLRHSLPG